MTALQASLLPHSQFILNVAAGVPLKYQVGRIAPQFKVL